MRRRPLRVFVVGFLLTGAAVAGIRQWAAGTGTPGGVSVAAATVGSGRAGDVDGDGYDDLAVGAPGAAVRGKDGAGYVGLTFGSRTGVHVARHQVLSRAYPGVPGEPRAGERFGSALALGDMDGDGYADLVVGASGATAGGVRGAGSVTVVFGTRTGLSHRAIGFHAPAPSPRGGFGGQLAMADFNHDGLRDLVVVDGKQVALVPGANNLRATGARDVTLRVPPGGGGGTQRIAAGDIDGDGFDDLVTVAFDDDPADEGTLAVLPGSGKGLRDKPLGQKIPLPFASYTPVVGDIDADGKDDVIIDTGFTDGPADAVLRTYPGGANGLRAGNAVSWKGAPHYGRTARLGDFDGDGHADLVVSDTKADARDGFHDAGAIVVAPGSTRWLNGSRARTITLDAEKVVGAAEAGDRFGSTLGLGDYDGDGTTDVAVGAPGKGKGVGAVGVLYGGAHGLSADRSILFGPDSLRADEAGASFGAALGG